MVCELLECRSVEEMDLASAYVEYAIGGRVAQCAVHGLAHGAGGVGEVVLAHPDWPGRVRVSEHDETSPDALLGW